jgi:methylmalonyl-CoA mutase cobalamin-binding subunit
VHPHRKSLVVFAHAAPGGDAPARALAESLSALGLDTTYVGRMEDPARIAEAVAAERADTVELWLARGGAGVLLLRALLRELIEIGRRDVSIVVHRAE